MLGLACLLLSLLLCPSISLISVSFLSTKSIQSLKLAENSARLGLAGWISSTSATWPSSTANLRYWQSTLQKNIVRAMKQARPHIRNSPQKLLKESRLVSTSLICIEHSVRVSHLLWIFWRSPFSESWRMAVDKSTARGESLWNAWNQKNLNLSFPHEFCEERRIFIRHVKVWHGYATKAGTALIQCQSDFTNI